MSAGNVARTHFTLRLNHPAAHLTLDDIEDYLLVGNVADEDGEQARASEQAAADRHGEDAARPQ